MRVVKKSAHDRLLELGDDDLAALEEAWDELSQYPFFTLSDDGRSIIFAPLLLDRDENDEVSISLNAFLAEATEGFNTDELFYYEQLGQTLRRWAEQCNAVAWAWKNCTVENWQNRLDADEVLRLYRDADLHRQT